MKKDDKTTALATGSVTVPEQVIVPQVDIFETPDDFVMLADMPGVKEDDLEVSIENKVMTVKGFYPLEAREGYEQTYGRYANRVYKRTFNLNDSIDGDRIEANFKNGVLEVRFPKAEPAKPKKISIKTK